VDPVAFITLNGAVLVLLEALGQRIAPAVDERLAADSTPTLPMRESRGLQRRVGGRPRIPISLRERLVRAFYRFFWGVG
jgi:hypothetical protein